MLFRRRERFSYPNISLCEIIQCSVCGRTDRQRETDRQAKKTLVQMLVYYTYKLDTWIKSVCVCACVRVCARARARVCVCQATLSTYLAQMSSPFPVLFPTSVISRLFKTHHPNNPTPNTSFTIKRPWKKCATHFNVTSSA